MKKYFAFGISLLILSGCASKTNEITKNVTCQIENEKAPSWICIGGNVKGYLTAVGSAQKSPLGFSFQKTEAVSAARDALSRNIETKVKNLFKRFESTTGTKKNLVAEKVLVNVSKQVSKTTLKNSRILTIWQSKNGTLYVLVGIPNSEIKNALTDTVNKNELFQRALAEKYQKELDKEIQKEFGK